MASKITPNDPRVTYKTANLNGVTYSYILAEPEGQPINTIFLIHGWPDLSFGWRYQIPFLTSLGLRVVVPDMLGYGGTDAPESPARYTFKNVADDMAALAELLGLSSIILGGHDWGGMVVYRIALHYPSLVSALFNVCTPFVPLRKTYRSMTVAPNFKYQIQLAGPDVESNIVGEEKIRQLLASVYGGRTPAGEPGFDTGHGAYFERLGDIGSSPLLSKEELDFYAKRYAIHGMHGPLNWYRTAELNFEDEKGLAETMETFKFDMPVLFISATRDAALPPALSTGMDKFFRSLTRGEVDADHWALWEKPNEVNQYIQEFLFGNARTAKANL
ncbi:uncharacterized protein BP5553_07570 [Venustampulla echinocandica]|uniref:AB hydrolase-1 domain-containing protein n=1 Tax=Venustampulla echinocandica TaxID=2656787 RepID=A0A370TGW9_9HELO|nr:uncharacterized protein BP5553_07570 [Venustampulla echinocandica]RDL34442.1 hypothetical protein BP5553_07570 [Venustampulla echinocandica]